MPMLIEYIDAIARQKQRDVLYVTFNTSVPASEKTAEIDEMEAFALKRVDWEDLPVRQQIIDWLESNGVAWQRCGGFARTNGWSSYQGQLYIDVAYDASLPQYLKLAAFLENPDGSMRLPNTTFSYLPLAHAMENAHHDEPGFWEKWAENL